jgi:hypothetical protein
VASTYGEKLTLSVPFQSPSVSREVIEPFLLLVEAELLCPLSPS